MAITDRELSEVDVKLSKKFGSEILILNSADKLFLANNGYVTGSDVLNTDVWREYRLNNEIPDGFEFDPKKYLFILQDLGILSDTKLEVLEKRKARKLKDATGKGSVAKKAQYKQLFKGRALFTDTSDLQGIDATLSGSTDFIAYDDLAADVKAELDSKMIESEEILEIKKPTGGTTGDISYIRVKEGREIIRRSMQAQGFKIKRTNLRAKNNPAGTRGRFNVFNDSQEQYYATGSWKTNNGGPRIQGPTGGAGSAKFIIIHRSGSRG